MIVIGNIFPLVFSLTSPNRLAFFPNLLMLYVWFFLLSNESPLKQIYTLYPSMTSWMWRQDEVARCFVVADIISLPGDQSHKGEEVSGRSIFKCFIHLISQKRSRTVTRSHGSTSSNANCKAVEEKSQDVNGKTKDTAYFYL